MIRLRILKNGWTVYSTGGRIGCFVVGSLDAADRLSNYFRGRGWQMKTERPIVRTDSGEWTARWEIKIF